MVPIRATTVLVILDIGDSVPSSSIRERGPRSPCIRAQFTRLRFPVLVFGSRGKPFNLCSIMSRQLIPRGGTFSGDDPLALVVEESEDAPDPCDYLDAPTVYVQQLECS